MKKSKKKKVIIISPSCSFPPADGGSEVSADLASRLSEFAETVLVLNRRGTSSGNISFKVVNSTITSPLSYLNLRKIVEMYRYLRKERPDCCILIQPFFFFPIYISSILLKAKFIIYALNIESQRFASLGKSWASLLKPFEFIAYRTPDRLFFISDQDREYAEKRYRLPKGFPEFLPHGLRFEPRLSIHVCDRTWEPRKIIFFGNFNYSPNSEAATDLITHIAPRLDSISDVEFKIVLIGRGLNINKIKLPALKMGTIEYLGHVANLENQIRDAAAMISAVRKGGGVQTKIIDAISIGLPVIASRSGCEGLDPSNFGSTLTIITDCDWQAFAEAGAGRLKNRDRTPAPQQFFEHYDITSRLKSIVEP